MSRNPSSHIGDGDLLRYADNELGSREAKQIESHLAACWQCRTELTELERTIGECVRYRQELAEALPDPPKQWFDIQRRFAEIDEAAERRPRTSRVWEAARAIVGPPRRWAPAMAVLLVVVLVVDQLRNTPSVRAAELLDKAVVAAESVPVGPRGIRIRTGAGQMTRVIETAHRAALSPVEERIVARVRPLFQAARYSWEDPLSARAFASWRNALASKQDEVTTLESPANCYQIRTTTESSELLEATLRLRVDNLRPVEGTWRFRNREFVEIIELDEVPVPAPAEIAEAAPARVSEPVPVEQPVESVRPATPGEELMVFALLRRLDADLGEPVEVTRDGGRVVVTGVGVNPALGQQIQDQLREMPAVSVEFSDPQPAPVPTSARSGEPDPRSRQIQAEIEGQLGGRLAYEQFSDEILETSEALMSRVHALRRLANRFPSEAENQLSPDERQLLWSLCREHAVAVAELAVALDERSRPALVALGATATASFSREPFSGSWQGATEDLFHQARRAESLLAAMLGGVSSAAPPEALPTEALAGVAQLRIAADEYMRITRE